MRSLLDIVKKSSLKETVNTFINEGYKKYIDLGVRRKTFYNQMSEYFNNDIPEKYIQQFLTDDIFDYVFDNLQQHDYKQLQTKLLKNFSNDIEYFVDGNGNNKIKSFWIVINNLCILKNADFKYILNMYGYEVRGYNDESIFIEPIESYDVSDYIYKDCHGICYHFTDNEAADKILKSGLRTKNKTGSDISKRIYLYATDKLLLNKTEELIKFIKKVTNPFKIKKNGLCVLKIDLNKLNKNSYVGLYKDTAMEERETVYTLYNIPVECIKKINFKI